MSSSNAKLDQNSRPTLTALSNANDGTIVDLWADPTTHRLLVDLAGGTPGGNNADVQFNNDGVFGGSDAFTWDSADNILGVNNIDIQSPGGSNGTILFSGANQFPRVSFGTDNSITFDFQRAASGSDSGGNINFTANDGGSSAGGGGGGSNHFFSGNATAGNNQGGDILFLPGAGIGGGRNGLIGLYSVSGGHFGYINTSLIATSDKTFTFPNVTGTLYVGSTTTAPSTTAAGSVTNRYGGATNFLGDPVAWATVNFLGTTYKVPLYT